MERSGLESGVTHTGFWLKRRTGAAIRHHRDPGGRAGSAEEDGLIHVEIKVPKTHPSDRVK